MSLIELNLSLGQVSMPRRVRLFLREASRRIERFQQASPIPSFVPSDFERAYAVLQELAAAEIAPGNRFCEWGSGFGVVTCLAAMLDFEAYGIEIEPELVNAAQELADDFDLPATFVQGSFIPKAADCCFAANDSFAWLTTEGDRTYEDLDLEADDFDVIFAYPWPDEEQVTGQVFDKCAVPGAVLVTYHGSNDLRQRRKATSSHRRRP